MTRSRTAPKRAPGPTSEPSPPLDLGPLPGLVGYALRRAQLAVFQDFVETMASLDVRPGQYSVLLLIAINPGVSQTEISEALGIKPTNLAVLLNGLQARGLTERRRDAADKRAHALHLTATGKTLMRRLDGLIEEHEQRVTASLGPDGKARLLKLLEKFV
jgi:DNA-binding MarR family transcriptional regulator